MKAKRTRVHGKVQPKKRPKKHVAEEAPVEDVWAKERTALANGTAPARRGRPKKIPLAPPPELVEVVTKAEGADGLAASLKAIALASLKAPGSPGHVEPKVAKILLDIAKESRQVQMRLKAKEGVGVISGAFEILTTQERAVVEAYRASKLIEPLKPGETPPPPPQDEPEPTKETTP